MIGLVKIEYKPSGYEVVVIDTDGTYSRVGAVNTFLGAIKHMWRLQRIQQEANEPVTPAMRRVIKPRGRGGKK